MKFSQIQNHLKECRRRFVSNVHHLNSNMVSPPWWHTTFTATTDPGSGKKAGGDKQLGSGRVITGRKRSGTTRTTKNGRQMRRERRYKAKRRRRRTRKEKKMRRSDKDTRWYRNQPRTQTTQISLRWVRKSLHLLQASQGKHTVWYMRLMVSCGLCSYFRYFKILGRSDLLWECCKYCLPNLFTSLFDSIIVGSEFDSTSFSSTRSRSVDSTMLGHSQSSPLKHDQTRNTTSMLPSLVINSQSIDSKREEFWCLLNSTKPDIIIGSETRHG